MACTTTLVYQRGYPGTVYHPLQTRFAVDVESEIVGVHAVEANREPLMGAEYLSYLRNTTQIISQSVENYTSGCCSGVVVSTGMPN